jgi:3D-(3,5/4)-trihydroxycyclohexane-1,2-dione acylhydrolase (decyclizing)
LSRSLGTEGFGTHYRRRGPSGQLDGEPLHADYAANAGSLGANAFTSETLDGFREALDKAKASDRIAVVVVKTDPAVSVPGYESWWNVPVAEVSEVEGVRKARESYEIARKQTRRHLLVEKQGQS